MSVTLSKLKRQGAGKKHFRTWTCAGFLKHNSGRNPQTVLQSMVYLSSVPHSHAVFDFATSCILAEATEDNFARHTAQALPTARLWARRDTIRLGTTIEAECPANKKQKGLYICLIERAY